MDQSSKLEEAADVAKVTEAADVAKATEATKSELVEKVKKQEAHLKDLCKQISTF